MAGYYNTSKHQELNDDAHRLLPREILDDIGIVVDPAEQQLLDVIEDLAARLAVALGGTPEKITSPANASRGVRGGLAERGEILAAPPPFSSAAHVVPCHAAIAMAEGFRNNNMVFFGASAQPATVHRRGTGTGVFLPRNEGACRAHSHGGMPAWALRNSKNFDSSSSYRRGQKQQPAMVIVKTPQQEMQPMAGGMVHNYLGVHGRPVVSQSRRNELIANNKTRIIQ